MHLATTRICGSLQRRLKAIWNATLIKMIPRVSAEMVQSPSSRDSSVANRRVVLVSSGWVECKSGANIKALALSPGNPFVKQAF